MKGDLPQSPYLVFIIAGAVLSSLFSNSCVSHQRYPAEWAALVSIEGNKCPDISGSYAIAGEEINKPIMYESQKIETWSALPAEKTDNKSRPEKTANKIGVLHLYDVFPIKYFISRGGITDATYVQISQPDDDTLEVFFMNDKGLIAKKIYSMAKKEYACSPKGISFSFVRGFTDPSFFSLAGGWGKFSLAKSLDGCLVINRESTGTGLIMMVPFWLQRETWHRFKQKSLP